VQSVRENKTGGDVSRSAQASAPGSRAALPKLRESVAALASRSVLKRRRGHIPWANLDRRLHGMRELWIATSAPDGRPDATPIWFWWDGASVYFTCAAVARKARNIAAQPEVVLLNGDGTDPIIVKGRAERVVDRAELERVDQAYREKYVAPTTGERATIFIADDHVYRVRPRLISAWSYADASTRTDFEPS
jgi:nitroimidazol reductase NimA-like FMN-containing flavoprotein (pyridoxamine 5'-phosphate oxidase superfamily)